MSKKKKLGMLSRPADWIYGPMSAVLLIVPLILCFFPVRADLDTYRLIGLEWNVDFFSQGKAVALYAICIFSAVFIVMEWRRFPRVLGDKRLRQYGILAGVYIIFTLLSSIFSSHPGVSFFGFYDRAEGFFVQLCYLYVMLFAAVAFRPDCDRRYATVPLMAVLVIELTLCVSQYVGHDLVTSDFVLRLMGAPAEGVSATFGAGIVYGTMYHYNHLGSFIAMVVPLFVVLALDGGEKPLWRTLYALSAVLSIALTTISSARGAYVGLACAALFGLILCAKCIGGWMARHKALSVAALGAIALALVLVFALLSDRDKGKIKAMIGDVRMLFTATEAPDATWPIQDVWNQDDGTVKIDFPQGALIIAIGRDGALQLTDENGASVAYREEAGEKFRRLLIDDERFAAASFKEFEGAEGEYEFSVGDWTEMFAVRRDDQNGTYVREYYLNLKMEIDHPEVLEFLKGKELIGSGRGFNWSRTLPLLKHHLILGSGPDTFPYEYPNRELAAKRFYCNRVNMLIEKAHNQYFQTFLQNGGVAFLAYMALLILYLIDCCKRYGFRRRYAPREYLGVALCLAVVGFMGDVLFIDSAVSTAPIFWVLLGTGIAVNRANGAA